MTKRKEVDIEIPFLKWLRKIPITTKVFSGVAIVLIITVIIIVIANNQMSSIHKRTKDISDNWLKSVQELAQVNTDLGRHAMLENQYLFAELRGEDSTHNPHTERAKYKQEMMFYEKEIFDNLKVYEKRNRTQKERNLYKQIEPKLTKYFVQSEVIIQKMEDGLFEEANQTHNQAQKELKKVQIELKKLINVNAEVSETITQESKQLLDRNRIWITSLFIFAIISGLLLAYFISKDLNAHIGGEPEHIAELTRQVSKGKLDLIFDEKKPKYSIYSSIGKLVETLKEISEITTKVSEGDLSNKVHIKSQKDILATSINKMVDNLSEEKQKTREQNWIKDGLNQLSRKLSGKSSLKDVGRIAISFVGHYLGLAKAVLYIYNPDDGIEKLYLHSSFAYTERDMLKNVCKVGEGIIGQVALEREVILLKNVSSNEGLVVTGTMQKPPRSILAIPLLFEDKLYGVIELASFEDFTKVQQGFLDEVNKIVSTYIYSSQKSEEIRTINTELEAKTTQLEKQTAELQIKKDEIENYNRTLEEKISERTKELSEKHDQLKEASARLAELLEEAQTQKETLEAKTKELEALQKSKETLTANIAHDLRNPLNIILSYGNEQLFTLSKEKRIERVQHIQRATKKIENYIDDMLDIQRYISSKLKLEKQKHNLFKSAKQASDILAFRIEEKNLQVQNQMDKNLEMVFDFKHLERVFENLLTNAIKYTPVNGTIILASKEYVDYVEVSVSDTGEGIPQDKFETIFKAFNQVEARKFANTSSTGLGLTFCKMVIEEHEGRIWVDSKVGQGSKFTFTLPKIEMGSTQQEKLQLEERRITYKQTEIQTEQVQKKSDGEDFTELKSIAADLQTLEIYEISELNKVLDRIVSLEPAIKEWKKAVQQAIKTMNQSKLDELIKQVT